MKLIICLSLVSVLGSPRVATADEKAPSSATVKEAVQRACALLISNQEHYQPDPPVGGMPDAELAGWQAAERTRLTGIRRLSRKSGAREWPYEGVHRVAPDGRIPAGYRVGGSAITCEALLEAPGLDSTRRDAITRSVEFMLEVIWDDRGMQSRPQTRYDVRGWGQAYALKFFLRALEAEFFQDADLAERVRTAIPHLIECLKAGQVKSGGWNYAGGGVSPFMTGSILLALFDARSAGFAVDAGMVGAALDALEAARSDKQAYAYSGKLRRPDEPMEGACARSAIAELVLYRAGRSNLDQLRRAVDGFFDERSWQELLARKSKQGTHRGAFSIAPYYFFFGHTYAALAVEHLPVAERSTYRIRMRELLWRTLEQRGGWNDRIFPRTESYSTAMAVLALIARDLPAVKPWDAGVAL